MARTSDLQALDVLLSLCAEHGLTAWSPLVQRVALRTREPLTLLVLGRMKAGKSTLINRLCGDACDRLLPIGAERTTARMTELLAAPGETFFRVALDGAKTPVDLATFRDLARGRAEAPLLEGTLKLRAELPALAKFGPVRIVDAPGFDSLHEEDAVWVREYLPDADAIFYCVEAGSGLMHGDLARLRELAGDDPAVGGFGRIHVLLTKADLPAGPGDAAAVLEQTREQLQAEFGHGNARLVAASPRLGEPLGLGELQAQIQALAELGVKAERVRRQTSGLAGRIREELEARSSALADPQARKREQEALRLRAEALEQAIRCGEGEACRAAQAALPVASASLAEGLGAFYAQEWALLCTFRDLDEVKDWLVRSEARRESSPTLREAWGRAVALVAAPFQELALQGVVLPEGADLDAPFVVGIPGWVYTAVEVAGTLAMLAGTGGGGALLKAGEAREGFVIAEKLMAGSAGRVFRTLGKAVDGLVRTVPILKPFLLSLHDLALDHARKALAAQLEGRAQAAAAEAGDILAGLPEHLLELARLQGTLRHDQDAALSHLLEEAARSETGRLAALGALRAALATLATLEA